MAKQADKKIYASTKDGRDITRGFLPEGVIIPSDDKLLQAKGGDYEIYQQVLRDDQVKTCWQQRQDAITSKEWQVDAGGSKRIDKSAADFIKETLQQIGFDDKTKKMHFGIFYGFGVAECLWGQDGRYVQLARLLVRNRRRFGFDSEGQLRLMTIHNVTGELMPARKFWVFSAGADNDDEYYGVGLAHWLYWPVFFKKHGQEAWLLWLRKYASPTAVAEYPTNGDADEALKIARAVQSDSGIAIPKGMVLSLLQAAHQGSADYAGLFDRMQEIIAKVILSQTATTEGTPGKLGNEETRSEVKEEVVKSDSDLLCGSFNDQVVKWLTDWNFPGAAYPEVWRVLEQDEDLNQRAERDQKIHGLGFAPTEKYIVDTYGEGWEKKQAPEPLARPTEEMELRVKAEMPDDEDMEFAEGGDDDLLPHVQRLETEMQAAWADMMEPVKRLVQGATSFNDIQQGLFELYPVMDTRQFQAIMSNAMLAMELKGRMDINDGN